MFEIAAQVDMHETLVNDAITMTIKITGEGNLNTFSDPEWQVGDEWRAFDSQSSTEIQSQEGGIIGRRTIKQVLVPIKSGLFTVPAIEFSFFDPQSGTYQTRSTQPIEVNVQGGGKVVNDSAEAQPDEVAVSAAGLRPIKAAPDVNSSNQSLTQLNGFWLLWLVPMLLLLGQLGWHLWRQNLINNPEARRSQRAAKNAYQALQKIDPDSGEYYREVGRILTTYLSEKINLNVVGLTQKKLSDILIIHGINGELVEQVLTCLSISEIGQYAPANQAKPGEFHTQTKSLISRLDMEFKAHKQS
jgi:hypothetical protein